MRSGFTSGYSWHRTDTPRISWKWIGEWNVEGLLDYINTIPGDILDNLFNIFKSGGVPKLLTWTELIHFQSIHFKHCSGIRVWSWEIHLELRSGGSAAGGVEVWSITCLKHDERGCGRCLEWPGSRKWIYKSSSTTLHPETTFTLQTTKDT